MLTFLPMILKPLIKSEKRPDAMSIGILKAKIINTLGKSINSARDPEIKVEDTKKAINKTKPTKYIKIPPNITKFDM
jgi:hypothetical protein